MKTILIVDDDPNNQRMLSYSLKKAGYEVEAASNGQAGYDILKNNPISLAILDLAMPIMDGISLLKLIRETEKIKTMPVIILTASGEDDELVIAEGIGVSGFLTKPFSSRLMLDIVASLLSGHDGQE